VTPMRDDPVVLSPAIHSRLVAAVRRRFPEKAFGYLISDVDRMTPTDFVMFESNHRNHSVWQGKFHSYGRYFVDHDDAGFVATPEESWRLQKQIWDRGMWEVGVFHSHRRHPANFSQIDFEMHMQRFDTLWHMVISMREPALPQVRVFAVSSGRVRELRVQSSPSRAAG
jgi:proteasome lid subunit RPN8/RPN11